MTQEQKHRYTEVALQALISKFPLIDRDGDLGEQIQGEEKQQLMKDICASACEYADWMEIVQSERYHYSSEYNNKQSSSTADKKQ